MSSIAIRNPDRPEEWDAPPLPIKEDWCRRCGYALIVHWATDAGCPDETVARERWGQS